MRKVFPLSLGGSDTCHFCKKRVYVMERLSAEGHFFHRECFRCSVCATTLRLAAYAFDSDEGNSQQPGTALGSPFRAPVLWGLWGAPPLPRDCGVPRRAVLGAGRSCWRERPPAVGPGRRGAPAGYQQQRHLLCAEGFTHVSSPAPPPSTAL